MLVFEEMEKTEYPEKSLSEQSIEPRTNYLSLGRRFPFQKAIVIYKYSSMVPEPC